MYSKLEGECGGGEGVSKANSELKWNSRQKALFVNVYESNLRVKA